MKRHEIEAKVREILVQQLEVSAEQLKPEATIMVDLMADSLAIVELALALEQEFKLDEISDEDLDSLRTVGAVINYVQEKLS